MGCIVKTVLKKIKERSSKYAAEKLKHGVCWVGYEDTEGYQHELEGHNHKDFCEDCIVDVLAEIESNERFEEPEGFKEIDYFVSHNPESNDFAYCEACGHIIASTFDPSEQELEHWLSLTKEEWESSLDADVTYYELTVILDNYGIVEENDGKIKQIAKTVFTFI